MPEASRTVCSTTLLLILW